MEFSFDKAKYNIKVTSKFKKDYKKISKQGKDKQKLIKVLETLANGQEFELQHRDHSLINDKVYKNCRECHIEPDWLLIYKIQDNELLLLLFATGSHSELFNK